MNSFNTIQIKLHQFINKFYFNELIKGLLLFFTIGLLYFFFTIFIEYFFWLQPAARTLLFWIFIIVECCLLLYYILMPIFKLLGLKNGISDNEAANLIGRHFPEVSDKLLNMLQLHSNKQHTDLIVASIEQKAAQLQPIPFIKAVDFKKNIKYVKFAFIPIAVYFLIFITGKINIVDDSFNRIVHYQSHFSPPAPFHFQITNTTLNVIEGESLTIDIQTIGEIVPEDAKIYFYNENYFLINKGQGNFQYTFHNLQSSFNFYLASANVISKSYTVNVLPVPTITDLSLMLDYPEYTGKNDAIITNSGNAIVPAGTKITWNVTAANTANVTLLLLNNDAQHFKVNNKTNFSLSRSVTSSFDYQIATSSKHLNNYENLNFNIQVQPDEFPKILVKSDIDSISRGPVQFVGQLSDDYGIHNLQLVYYDSKNPSQKFLHNIDVSSSNFTDFYYVFPEGISIDDGVNYELYFEVFDNDVLNGYKKTRSTTFKYYTKTPDEIKADLIQEQQSAINTLSNQLSNFKKNEKSLNAIQNELQKKAAIQWNDSKKLQEFLDRQLQYQQLIEKQAQQLEKNLNELPAEKALYDKKEALKERLNELKNQQKQDELYNELQNLTKKLDNESMLKKLEEFSKKNKNNQQSLERILELTKRFYVEQKLHQLKDEFSILAEKQSKIAKNNAAQQLDSLQQEINAKFQQLKNELKATEKENNKLLRPYKIPDTDELSKQIEDNLTESLKSIKQNDIKKAKSEQQNAAKNLQELSKNFEMNLAQSEGEMIDENIDDLRKILENLIEFSFQQEQLLTNFTAIDASHPSFSKNLKEQQKLKVYFEHIDDSLYTLSLRIFSLSTAIQNEVATVHHQLDLSLSNFSENLIDLGSANQQFVITSANNLANSLSDLLQSLMNASPSFGKGKGSKNDFNLPDIIKKQNTLIDAVEKGLKDGKNNNGQNQNNSQGEGDLLREQEMESLFEIYKQQTLLKQLLNEFLNGTSNSTKNPNTILKEMELLEEQLLNKGFSNDIVTKMKKISYELLKLENAKKEQGEDQERKATSNNLYFDTRNIQKLKLLKEYFNSNEILNRQSLPLRSIYKEKTQEYFNSTN